jgi:predicted nucleotidyltransferase
MIKLKSSDKQAVLENERCPEYTFLPKIHPYLDNKYTKANLKLHPIVSATKQKILLFEPNATVYLFGSRARNTAATNSDWDFLVLTPTPASFKKEIELGRILNRLFYELESKGLLNAHVFSLGEWRTENKKNSPFYQTVTKDWIEL